MQSQHFLARAALAGLLSLAFACGSDEPKGEMTDEQKLGYYLENALRFWDMKDLDRTEDQALRGLEVDPDSELLLLLVGWVRLRRGSAEDVLSAIGIFEDLERADDYRVNLGLGEAMERKGVFYDEASRDIASGRRFTDARDPQERSMELADISFDSWQASTDSYERALELKPENRDALNGLLRVTSLMGRDHESIGWAKQLLALLETNVTFWRKQLARPEITARDERRFRNLLKADTELEVGTRRHTASVFRLIGLNEEAIAFLDRVIELDPELAEAYSRRAQILFELGNYEKASNSIDRFLAISKFAFEHPSITEALELQSDCVLAMARERAE